MNTYFITGATSDLGKGLIDSLLSQDADSVVFAHGFKDEYKLSQLEEKYGDRISYVDADLSSPFEVEKMINELENKKVLPSHFVHFPALPVINSNFKNFDENRFFKDLEVQVHSAIKLCKFIIPYMKKEKHGRIVFMQTSYTIGCPPKNVAAYTMAKSAIGALVKSLATDYAKFGITVNCVAPSMIETNFVKDLNHVVVEMSAANNPMGRNAKVEDVIPAIEFLLSDGARFITGTTIPITGGSAMI